MTRYTAFIVNLFGVILWILLCLWIASFCHAADCAPKADCAPRGVTVTVPVTVDVQPKPIFNDGVWWVRSGSVWIFRDEANKRWVSEKGSYEFIDGAKEWTPAVGDRQTATPACEKRADSTCTNGRCYLQGGVKH